VVTLWTCIREAAGSNLVRETSYHGCGSRCFCKSLEGNSQLEPRLGSDCLLWDTFRFISWKGKRFVYSPQRQDQLWDWHSPLCNGYLSLGIKGPEYEANLSYPSSSEINNTWMYAYVFMMQCVISLSTEMTLPLPLIILTNWKSACMTPDSYSLSTINSLGYGKHCLNILQIYK
jgi:hypothetical protein